jgi:hypothetical protein
VVSPVSYNCLGDNRWNGIHLSQSSLLGEENHKEIRDRLFDRSFWFLCQLNLGVSHLDSPSGNPHHPHDDPGGKPHLLFLSFCTTESGLKSSIRKAPQQAANEPVSPNRNVIDSSSGDPCGLPSRREKTWNRNIIGLQVVLQYEYGTTKQLRSALPDHRLSVQSTGRYK